MAGLACKDKGHEFMCRFGPGACDRTGLSSCNAPDDDGKVTPFPAHRIPVSIDPHELSTTCWCDPTLEWENHHVIAVNHIDTDNGDS